MMKNTGGHIVKKALLAATIPALLTCRTTAPQASARVLRVNVQTVGPDPDPNGYSVQIGTRSGFRVAHRDSVAVTDLTVGSHPVLVEALAINCTLDPMTPSHVQIEAEEEVLDIVVRCQPMPTLAFHADRNGPGAHDVYVSDSTGQNAFAVTNIGTGFQGMNPVWNPDGSSILFSAPNPDQHGNDIYRLDVLDNQVAVLTDIVGSHRSPAWHPSGDTIAFSVGNAPSGIWRMNADGTNPHLFIGYSLEGFTGTQAQAAWSPDGTRIAFRGGVGNIYVSAADGSSPMRVALSGASPSWSPDGQHLAFSRSNGELFVVNADGTGELPVPGTGLGTLLVGAPVVRWHTSDMLWYSEPTSGSWGPGWGPFEAILKIAPDGTGRVQITDVSGRDRAPTLR